MKNKTYNIVGIITIIIMVITTGYYVFRELSEYGEPRGLGRGNYPYYITTEATTVKNILVPKGTVLTYDNQFLRSGRQSKALNEKTLTDIELPEGETIDWGGVPVNLIIKFFNQEMRGYTVYADFSKLSNDKKTKFSELWQSTDYQLGVDVKNIDDWSYNKENIMDVESCGVNNQRFFKEDRQQQQHLDDLYRELQNNNN